MNAICSAEEHFRRGEAALQEEDHNRALEYFRAANRLDPTSPRYRSYFGLCLGLVERRFDKALDLCRSAAKEEFFNPALYTISLGSTSPLASRPRGSATCVGA